VSALQSPPSGRIPLVLSGATLDDPALLALIEELGGQVVGDDLCNGERYFDTLVPEVEDPGARAADPDPDTGLPDPWGALAERYLRRPPCPCKHSGLDVREKHLLSLATARGARGVIFVLKKFCDPHAWDYPPLAAALRTAGIPHLLLETEATTPVGVLRTRIEAFLEMLE
jgi:benzoyl-CoA reductase/2-hydroxyglutaryl-CoA dehydratase subunit BcrC/BadD/HgdB